MKLLALFIFFLSLYLPFSALAESSSSAKVINQKNLDKIYENQRLDKVFRNKIIESKRLDRERDDQQYQDRQLENKRINDEIYRHQHDH